MLDSLAAAGYRCPVCDDDGWVRRTVMYWQHAMPGPTNLCVDHPCRCEPRDHLAVELLDPRLLRFPGWV